LRAVGRFVAAGAERLAGSPAERRTRFFAALAARSALVTLASSACADTGAEAPA
jgi:hypothetical protein